MLMKDFFIKKIVFKRSTCGTNILNEILCHNFAKLIQTESGNKNIIYLNETLGMQCNPICSFINFKPINCDELEQGISTHYLMRN